MYHEYKEFLGTSCNGGAFHADNESDTSMLEEMQQKLISIAEDFDKWLEEMAKKYNMPKDDVQALIKQFLIGL